MTDEGFARPEPPEGWQAAFVARADAEAAALAAMRVASPWCLPVRSARPVVRWAEAPTPARPDGPLSVADAAACAAQVCDVLARLHAEGVTGLGTGPADVRVLRDGGAWRAQVVVPHLPHEGRCSHADAWAWRLRGADASRVDLAAVVGFLRDLVEGYVPGALCFWYEPAEYAARPLPSLGDAALTATLGRVLAGESGDGVPDDAASLAGALAGLTADPARWQAHASGLPRARPAVTRRDWARVTELGEEELAARPGDRYVVYPLAAAWHQRACEALGRGDAEAAWRHLARCLELDPWVRYLVTRGAMREARGDLRGALEDFEAACAQEAEASSGFDELEERCALEEGRARYACGVTRLRLGDEGGALEALRGAHERVYTAASAEPPYVHDHGAVREAWALLPRVEQALRRAGGLRRRP